MKNPFFNLPDVKGELLDIRLALRLILRQAFKPILGIDGHPTPRHTVRSVIKPTFVPSVTGTITSTLNTSLRFMSKITFRVQQMLSEVSGLATASFVSQKSVPAKRNAGKPIAGKKPARQGSPLPVAAKSTMGKAVNKSAANKGKRVVPSGNAGTSTTRVIHPTTAQPEKVRDGMWVEYNKHAVVVARGTYTNNQKNGHWREYYDTGELMIEEHFVLGEQHGRFATFHPNGQCCSEGNYNHGHREGRFFMYDESGRHVRTLTFKRDKMVDDVMIGESLAMA